MMNLKSVKSPERLENLILKNLKKQGRMKHVKKLESPKKSLKNLKNLTSIKRLKNMILISKSLKNLKKLESLKDLKKS